MNTNNQINNRIEALRNTLDGEKDTVLHHQNAEDIDKFLRHIPHTINEEGIPIAKGEILVMLVGVQPKSRQSSTIQRYRQNLNDFFYGKEEKLNRFRGINKLVYLYFYLSPNRFDSDVDNLAKPILDALKPYFGDDKRVHILIAEKKQLSPGYDPNNYEILENTVIIVLDAMTREDILKV